MEGLPQPMEELTFHFEIDMYLVVRCPSCEKCWGIKGKPKSCPHCGIAVRDDLEILSTTDSAAELQQEVAILNMPESLRDEMREKISPSPEMNTEPSPNQIIKCIRIAAEDDVIRLDRLSGALRGSGISISAIDVAEEAVSQGLLMRTNDGNYLLLQ